MRKINIDKKAKKVLDKYKKFNHPSKELKIIKDLLAITNVSQVNTSKKYWSNGKAKFNGKYYNFNKHGHRENECIEKPKLGGKCHKFKKHGHKSSECKTKMLDPT